MAPPPTTRTLASIMSRFSRLTHTVDRPADDRDTPRGVDRRHCGRVSVPAVRDGDRDDSDAIGRLLHAFNREFDEPTPGPRKLADRVRHLLAEGQITVLLAGDGPDGLAVLRFRPAIWTPTLECYLAELYVVPGQRGRGLGRALMEAAIELARREGATYM